MLVYLEKSADGIDCIPTQYFAQKNLNFIIFFYQSNKFIPTFQ